MANNPRVVMIERVAVEEAGQTNPKSYLACRQMVIHPGAKEGLPLTTQHSLGSDRLR